MNVGSDAQVGLVLPIPTPYRSPMLEFISSRTDMGLTALYCAEGRKDRPWGDSWRSDAFRQSVMEGTEIGGNWHLNWSITDLLEEEKFDVVCISGYTHPTALLAYGWCIRSDTPFIPICESHLRKKRSFGRKAVKGIVLKWLFEKASAYFATGSMQAEYLSHYGASMSEIFIFPNTPDVEYLRSMTMDRKDGGRRQKKGLRIGFVARLVARKNFKVLTNALQRLNGKMEYKLTVVGDGVLRERWESEARRLSGEVEFTGFVAPESLYEYYKTFDVLVLPSFDEPWGVVVNEAMAVGAVPVASTMVGAAGDLVEHGENGYLFEPDRPEDLASCLLKLTDVGHRERMRWRSIERVSEWDYEMAARQFSAGVNCAID